MISPVLETFARGVLCVIPLALGCAAAPDADYDASAERAALLGKSDGGAVPRKQWTLLFYGAGDNSLGDEIQGAVNKLESVGSTADVNLIAFYDHPTLGAARVYLEKDPDLTAIHSPGLLKLGAVDSGIPQTLESFASWAIGTFPAEHYALVIDSHGGGTTQLIAFDESTGHAMSLTELWEAVDFIHQRSHRTLSVLGGDTCLTQTVEQAVQLAPDVDQIVMSQNLDYGWTYDTIAQALVADPAQTDVALAKVMVDAYGTVAKPALTMSTVDTSKTAGIVTDVNALAVAVQAYLATTPAAANDIKSAGLYRPEFGSYVDAHGLAQFLIDANWSPEVAATAAAVLRDVDGSITSMFTSPDVGGRAHGLSLFLPTRLDEDTLAEYRVSSFAHSSQWDELVASLFGLQ